MNDIEINKLTEDYKAITVKHDRQEQAKNRVTFLTEFGANVSMIVLAGPTGAGKSTLLHRFAESYLESKRSLMEADPSMIPLVHTVATASGHRAFDWKRLYSDGLRSMSDPFAASRLRKVNQREPASRYLDETRSAALLREQVETQFAIRKTQAWIIDEAQHIVRGGKSGGPTDQLDVLKSVAQTAGVKLILSGTYDLPDYMSSSGQLSRRSEIVSLDRYLFNDAADKSRFANVANALLTHVPKLIVEPKVTNSAVLKLLYVGSVGCVGICKDWIARAYAFALQEDSLTLTLEHLKRARLTDQQLETIFDELSSGEAKFSGGGEGDIDGDLASLISGPKAPKPKPPIAGEAKPERANVPKRRPGHRNPARNPVGMEAAAA